MMQWMMATYFELTSLARVKFPPHKPLQVQMGVSDFLVMQPFKLA
jgi:hypothetical protein